MTEVERLILENQKELAMMIYKTFCYSYKGDNPAITKSNIANKYYDIAERTDKLLNSEMSKL